MRYLLMIYEVDRGTATATPSEMESDLARYAAFTRETHRRNAFQAGEALEPTSTATTVRVRDGKAFVTDGPFAETKEFLGGFYLLECRDLDEAIELARMIPAVERGSIEIRPIWELPAGYGMAETAGTAAG
jgi:hypothetical protein